MTENDRLLLLRIMLEGYIRDEDSNKERHITALQEIRSVINILLEEHDKKWPAIPTLQAFRNQTK